MNDKEISRFVNSKDIKRHLLEIGYHFTTAEATWLVYQCEKVTFKEKCDAWEDIIATMPDQQIDSPHFDEPYESIHKVITDYIDLKKHTSGKNNDKALEVSDLNLPEFFEDLWFHFPTPFKKGDILYNPRSHCQGFCAGPIVMTGITPLKYEEDGRSHTDSSDMNVWGYFQDEENGTLYQEVTWNYMDYEYYPEDKLTGKTRILKALSNLIKEKIDLELFIKAYHFIILEEMRNDFKDNNLNFTDEGLELAGLR